MISDMSRGLMALLLAACFAVPSTPLTAKLTGQVNSCIFDGDQSCYPGPISIKMGVYDFTGFLSRLSDPMAPAAIWPDSLPWLDPSFDDFLYAETLTIQGRDITITPSGTPYEIDITSLMNWCLANNGSEKPLGFIFLTLGGTGKIHLFSDETFSANTPAQLVGVSINDGGPGILFRFDPLHSTVITGAIQYTGHCRQRIRYRDDRFVIGGHQRLLTNGDRVDKDRCAFFFHRGMAQYLGWKGADYDPAPFMGSDPLPVSSSANPLRSVVVSPNPFNRFTQITYTLPSGSLTAPVHIIIRDISGRTIYESDGASLPGTHQFQWNASPFNSGTYFLNIVSGKDYSQSRRMLSIK